MRIWLLDGYNILIGEQPNRRIWSYRDLDFVVEQLSPFVVKLKHGKHQRWVGVIDPRERSPESRSKPPTYGVSQGRIGFSRRGIRWGSLRTMEDAMAAAADRIIEDAAKDEPSLAAKSSVTEFMDKLSPTETRADEEGS